MNRKRRKDRKPITVDRPTRRFLSFTRYWILFFTAMAIGAITILEIIAPSIAFNNGFLHQYLLTPIIIESLMGISLYVLGAYLLKSWVGNLMTGTGIYITADMFFEILRHPTDFTLAAGFWWFFTIIGAAAIIFALLRIITLITVWVKKLNPKPGLFERRKQKHLIAGIALMSLSIGLSIGHFTVSSNSFGHPITIQPQDYQIEFRTWASYNVQWYLDHPNGTQMLEQMDRHGVTIQNTLFQLRDADGVLESFSPTVYQPDINDLVGNLTWFQSNYPNIKFQYYTFGIGRDSCGNYEGSIYTPAMAKRFVDVCKNYSLGNVVGIYTDWEGPNSPSSDGPNSQALNGWHQALWQDAFAYIRANFPNWTLSCCYPGEMSYDGWDGDDDLQYFSRYNVFTPEWDDYGPMIYRSCGIDDRGREGEGSFLIYSNAKVLLEATLHNDVSKATMWLGCTGCGPYRNDTIVYEHGRPMDFGNSTGFDAFARDVLILKHFGFKTFSIFHAIEKFVPEGGPTGFFHQYGFADALDKLNATVNGVNSTQSFTIWSDASWTPKNPITLDMQLNFNRLEYIPVMAALTGSGFVTILISWFQKKAKNKRKGRSEGKELKMKESTI
ncbi:MAG: hypothetical protein ACTSUE_24620 [Promethearchaeota archaeon]